MTVVWALTWLGQSAALAALSAALVRLPGFRSSAAARHAAWASTLVLCAGLLAWPLLPGASAGPAFHPARTPPVVASAAVIPLAVLPAPVIQLSSWLGWIWVLGAVVGVGLAARDVRQVVCLKRRTVPLTAEEQAALGQGLSAWTSSRAPRLAWCAELDAPAVLGFVRPVIALPRAQVSCLLGSQPRLVVLHELAHVRRGDDWWALAGRIILAVAWVNPAVHWVLREMSVSREMACDEWVVKLTAAPVAYATCLADVAALRTRARRLRLAHGVIGRPGTLRRRVVGVLALSGRAPARASAVVAWLAPVAVCAAAAGLLRLPPVVIVGNPPDAVSRVPAQAGPADPVERVSDGAGVDARVAAGPQRQGPGARSARRVSETRSIPAGSALALEPAFPVPAVKEMAVEQADFADAEPLASSPVALAGEAGVPAAGVGSVTYSPRTGDARWWGGPAAIGHATGGAAATAGRATASFFSRFGFHVPQVLNR